MIFFSEWAIRQFAEQAVYHAIRQKQEIKLRVDPHDLEILVSPTTSIEEVQIKLKQKMEIT